MIVDFKSIQHDYYGKVESPTLVISTPDGRVISTISNYINLQLTLRYNDVSEVSFTVPAINNGVVNHDYDKVLGMRLINVEPFGDFILVNPITKNDNGKEVKECKAYSLEYAFNYKRAEIPAGTYNFYNPIDNSDTILTMITEFMPDWSIGTVDRELIGRWRTFENVDDNLYSFMMTQLQESYNCLFLFDTKNKKIHVKSVNSEVPNLPIYLSYNNLVKSIDVTELSDDIVTALSGYGSGDDVNISSVNPNGTNTIYNLDYFIHRGDLPEELSNKWVSYRNAIETYSAIYSNLMVLYMQKINEYYLADAKCKVIETDLSAANTTYLTYQTGTPETLTAEDVAKYLDKDVEDVTEQEIINVRQDYINERNAEVKRLLNIIEKHQLELDAQTSYADKLNEEVESINNQLNDISALCSIKKYFTASEYKILTQYLKKDSITEDTFVVPEYSSAILDSHQNTLTSESNASVFIDGAEITATNIAEIFGKNEDGTFEPYITDPDSGELLLAGVTEEIFQDITLPDQIAQTVATQLNDEARKVTYEFRGGKFNFKHTADKTVVDLENNVEKVEPTLIELVGDVVNVEVIYNKDNLTSYVDDSSPDITKAGFFIISATLRNAVYDGTEYPSMNISMQGMMSGDVPNVGKNNIRLYINNGVFYNTASTTEYQKQTVIQELYDYTKTSLEKLAWPSYEFTVDSANFIFAKEFEPFKDQLELGRTINLALDEDEENIIQPILIEVKLNYDNESDFGVTFSNKFHSSDSVFELADIIKDASFTSHSVSLNKANYAAYKESKAGNQVSNLTNNNLDVAKNAIVNSTNQGVEWNSSGMFLRKKTGPTAYDPEQVGLINNVIAFTDDNWESVKLALGHFTDENTGDSWGIVAPNITGTLLAGENLVIENTVTDDDGQTVIKQFKVDGSGAWLNNASFVLSQEPNADTGYAGGKIMIDPKYGIAAGNIDLFTQDGTNIIPSFKDEDGNMVWDESKVVETADGSQYYVPKNTQFLFDIQTGNAYFGGTISGENIVAGTINGVAIESLDASKLTGSVNTAQLTQNVTNAINSGNGTINGERIGELSADKITSGTISSDVISADTISGSVVEAIEISGDKISSNYLDVQNGYITNAMIGSLGADKITSGTISSDRINADSISGAVVDAIEISGQKISSDYLDVKDGYITNAMIDDLSADKITSGNISADRMQTNIIEAINAYAGNITADSALINTAVIGDLSSEYAHITNGAIDNANIDVANVNNLSTKVAEIADAQIGSATITQAQIENLSSDFAHITNGLIDNADISHANVDGLNANYAHIASGTIDNANIDVANVNNLNTKVAEIADAQIGNATISQAQVENLSSDYAHITNGAIDNAKIGHANVDGLSANYAQINFENVNNSWIENGVIKDAAITDAQIIGVGANKITAGTIDASKITVTNLNADNLTVGTINGERIGKDSISLDKLTEEVPTKEYVDNMRDTLQDEIDNAIETWTVSTVPTLNNEPASAWTTDEIKRTHVGDVCYVVNASNSANGYCYRFTLSDGVYSWVLIKDSDVTKALQDLITVQGDISGLKTFESQTASWITSTDSEISSVKNRTTTIETTYSTKSEAQGYASSAQTAAINAASADATSKANAAQTAATNAAKEYTDEATENMATIDSIPTKVSDLDNDSNFATTGQVDTAKSEAISSANSTAQGYANTAKSEAISSANSAAQGYANTAKSEAISAAATDATNKANAAQSAAISSAATDATNKANAALNSAKEYTDAIEIGGRNLIPNTSDQYKQFRMGQWYYALAVSEDFFGLSVGETYTYRVKIKPSTSRTFKARIQFYNSESDRISIYNPDSTVFVKDTEGYVWITSTLTEAQASYKQMELAIQYGGEDTGSYMEEYSELKLERGNKATDWTSAPEDITADAQAKADAAQAAAKAYSDQVVSTKVETAVFNEVKQTVDENSAAITSLSSRVDTKADGSTVTTLSNTVNEVKQTADTNKSSISTLTTTISGLDEKIAANTTAIEQTDQKIELKASQTDVDSLTGRVEQAESSITAQAGQIESKVSKDGIISSINQSAESITINAGKINLNGAVTFDSFNSTLQATINNKATSSDVSNAISGIKNDLSSNSGQTQIDGAHIITGTLDADRITANSITSSQLATDAIKSKNYLASTNTSSPYSALGTFLDLQNGNLYTPNFGVNSVTGAAYLNGTIYASDGKIGDYDNFANYWAIGSTEDSNNDDLAYLKSVGKAYIQTGNWQLSNDSLNTQSYSTTTNAITYPTTGTNYYDYGMHAPGFETYSGNFGTLNDSFLYIRKSKSNAIPTIDADWNYLFRVDRDGKLSVSGLSVNGVDIATMISNGVEGGAYVPTSGGSITGNLSVSGTITGTLSGTATKANQANITTTVNAIAKYGDNKGTFKNTNATIDDNGNAQFMGNVVIGTTASDSTIAGAGNFKIGVKNDSYGLMPYANNWNSIGLSGLAWYRAYVNNYYGANSYVTNWGSGNNIGTAVTANNDAVLGNVNFYNNAVVGAIQTKTNLTANTSAGSNITVTLPASTGTLALTSDTVASATRLASSAGSATQPIYFSNGQPVATTYALNKTVPSDAKFTDTTYSAGTGLNLNGNTFSVNNTVVTNNTTLQTTNPFGGRSIYISKIDNGFYSADKRWTVTGLYTGASNGTYTQSQLHSLFNGNYEDALVIPKGCTAKIRITFDTDNETATYNGVKVFPGYPYGYIYLSYYYVNTPSVHSKMRVYCNYDSHGIGEHEYTMDTHVGTYSSTNATTGNSNLIEVVRQPVYAMSYIEFEITGATNYNVSLTQIEIKLDRPDSSKTPFLSKYAPEKLYYSLTAPSFIGDLNGNATSATKATNDSDNNAINTTYFKRSGGTITGNIVQTTGYIYGEDPAGSSYTNHALLLGHQGSDHMDFYEYGGLFNFYKSSNGTNVLLGKITENGWEGNVIGSASKLSNTTAIGSASNPVYFSANGVPVASDYTFTTTAPSSGLQSTDRTVPTSYAVWDAIQTGISANAAMVFKGTIGSSGATITSLPANHTKGDTYIVSTSGTYAGVACTPGDMVICITTGTTATNSHWTVVHTNTGAVTGPASSTANHIATFSDSSGGAIKDSGYTIATSVPANAVFTDTNKYHKTGSWSGLTYTAEAVGGADALAFTIPTGNSANTVAPGNHTHNYLSLDGGTVTGSVTMNTQANTTPFYISRSTGHTEAVAHGVDDGSYNIVYTNDEATSQLKLRFVNTDTESDGGENASDKSYFFTNDGAFYPQINNSGSIGTVNNKWANVYATTFNGALNGNASTATTATTATTANALAGFSKTNTITWGSLSNSAYSYINRLDTANGGSVAFADKDGQTSMQIDGAFYQNEGQYKVLDTSDIYNGLDSTSTTKALSANQGYLLKTGGARDDTKLPLAGGTMTGTTILPENQLGLHFRNNSNYHSGLMYQTAGNEALVFANKQAITSYMFLNGVDPTTMTSGTWTMANPAMQIKNNSVYINKLIPNGTTPTYKLYTNGDVQFNGKVGIAEAVTMEYNATNKCLNFVFS